MGHVGRDTKKVNKMASDAKNGGYCEEVGDKNSLEDNIITINL